MYLNTNDYQTVWQLAHGLAGEDCNASDPEKLTPEVQEAIYRILIAIKKKLISVRTTSRAIFLDDGFFDILYDIRHLLKFNACLTKSVFNKSYLDSLYVWRPEVLSWCESHRLSIPPIWRLEEIRPELTPANEVAEDDEETGWYESLTAKRKGRVACLEMAKILWKINPKWMYEEVYRHPIMIQYGTPQVFTLKAFKRWASEFAPEAVKTGGRPKDTSEYDVLIKH